MSAVSRLETSKSNHGRLGDIKLAPKAPHPQTCETDALSSDRVVPKAAHEYVKNP